jgi:hypothetical protein
LAFVKRAEALGAALGNDSGDVRGEQRLLGRSGEGGRGESTKKYGYTSAYTVKGVHGMLPGANENAIWWIWRRLSHYDIFCVKNARLGHCAVARESDRAGGTQQSRPDGRAALRNVVMVG